MNRRLRTNDPAEGYRQPNIPRLISLRYKQIQSSLLKQRIQGVESRDGENLLNIGPRHLVLVLRTTS